MKLARKRYNHSAAVSLYVVMLCISGCSQMDVVEQKTDEGYYTGHPDIEFVSIPAGVYEMTVYKPRNTDTSGIVGQSIIRKIKLNSIDRLTLKFIKSFTQAH